MKRQLYIKAAAITAIALIALAVALIILQYLDRGKYAETRDTMSEGFGQLKTVEWGGHIYREKPAVTTILVAGIDRANESEATGVDKYRRGGQADFLVLLAIDHTDKKIHQLQIDRDTMADVAILGVFGNETGTRKLQICLSHNFGATPQDNAKYTVRAVQNLLGGIEIDGYYMFRYTAVSLINDMLGGITVTIPDDMTNANAAWTPGTTVTLHGKEAETFVRTRRNVANGTNKERMVRQNEFMSNAVSAMKKKISKDLSYGENLLKAIQDYAVTNMTVKRLAEEMNKANNYEIIPVDHPDGENHINPSTQYMEFYIRENAAIEWILDHLYTRQ